MTVERVNPELVKKSAQLAVPGCEWFIRRSFHNLNQEYIYDVMCISHGEFEHFDPIGNDADAMKLERALKKDDENGWMFDYRRGYFLAYHHSYKTQEDPSDTLLLLRCVSSQFSIPLYQVSK